MGQPIISGRFLGILFLVLVLDHSTAWTASELPPGSQLPEFALQMPNSSDVAKYLGLENAKTFSISQIPAKLTVVEFFSVICPVCHRQAPRANRIFNFIKSDEQLGKDIKMIAIGLGNKPNQIRVYARNFKVVFPLFADSEKKILEKTKVENIPLTVVVDKTGKVLTSHLGVIKDLDRFLRELRNYHKKQ